MQFKNKTESWNVPPESCLTQVLSVFQTAFVLFTPAHLRGEGGCPGREGGTLWRWPLQEIHRARLRGWGQN